MKMIHWRSNKNDIKVQVLKNKDRDWPWSWTIRSRQGLHRQQYIIERCLKWKKKLFPSIWTRNGSFSLTNPRQGMPEYTAVRFFAYIDFYGLSEKKTQKNAKSRSNFHCWLFVVLRPDKDISRDFPFKSLHLNQTS